MELKKLHYLWDKASRTCRLALIDGRYVNVCECGKPESEHNYIASGLGLACRVIIQCKDGVYSAFWS